MDVKDPESGELSIVLERLRSNGLLIKCFKCHSYNKLPPGMKTLQYDPYYQYCPQCKDPLKRLALSWIDVVSVTLYNLTLTQTGLELEGKVYFHWKSQICDFIEKWWDLFWIREKSTTWRNSVASCLSTCPKFVSLGSEKRNGEQGLWALDDIETTFNDTKQRQPQYSISKDQSLFESIHPTKRKNKTLKKRLLLDYSFTKSIQIYPDLENPAGKVKISSNSTHSAPQMIIKDFIVKNDKGYRMCKSSHGVWDSKWYYEVEILNDVGCARIGFSQISGDLQAPCGYDQFSYSIRSSGGLFHDSNQICSSQPYRKGDVLGLVIDLDKPRFDPKFPGLLIDTKLLTRLWDESRMDEYLPFRHKVFEILDNSRIDCYVNGSRNEGFKGLFQGKYYASISLYGGCEVKVNFGPDFKYFQKVLDIEREMCENGDLEEIKGFYESYKLKQWCEFVDDYISEEGKSKDGMDDDLAEGKSKEDMDDDMTEENKMKEDADDYVSGENKSREDMDEFMADEQRKSTEDVDYDMADQGQEADNDIAEQRNEEDYIVAENKSKEDSDEAMSEQDKSTEDVGYDITGKGRDADNDMPEQINAVTVEGKSNDQDEDMIDSKMTKDVLDDMAVDEDNDIEISHSIN